MSTNSPSGVSKELAEALLEDFKQHGLAVVQRVREQQARQPGPDDVSDDEIDLCLAYLLAVAEPTADNRGHN